MNRPQLDESKATDYIGKTVLVGITYVDHEDTVLDQHQWFGEIVTFSNEKGIKLKLCKSDEVFGLPPDPSGLQKAEPGVYRLRSTGDEVVDPDYVSTWTVVKPQKAKSSDG